ncbi:MAG: hypothetical protein MR739_14210 [Spirochaetia bacterium]|nr:hypothetical protein [Spirochaetia bacterium]
MAFWFICPLRKAQKPNKPKNRLFALRYRSSASLASLSPVDCFAGATILATV